MKLASALVILEREHADPATIGEFDAALEVLGAHPLAGKLLAVPATSFKELQDQAGLLLDTDATFRDFDRNCCGCIESCQIGTVDSVAVAQFKLGVNRYPQ